MFMMYYAFKEIFPALYNIAHYPHVTVASVMSIVLIIVSFRRVLTQEKLVDWHNLVTMISNIRLQEGTFIDWIVLRPIVTRGFGN
jgi:hypothetical protein